MPDHVQKQHEEEAAQAAAADSASENPEQETDAGENGEPEQAAEPGEALNEAEQNVPRWRQIEIMRERAQLRKELADLDDDLDEMDELEEEVFGSESENEELYQHGEPGDEDVDFDDEDLDEDDLDDDLDTEDFEDFEED